MKIAFVLQYYPYQYEQFKTIIDRLNADAFYRIHTNERDKKVTKTLTRVEDGSFIKLKEFPEDYYDCLIYTGTWCKSLIKFADKCKYKKIICISHSLIGSLYDISIVTPTYSEAVGLVPNLWASFDSFSKRLETADGECFYEFTKTHPMISSVVSRSPRYEVEKGTLGAIFGELSPFDHFSKILDDLVSRYDISKVKIKFHPLNYGRKDLVEMFSSRGYEVEILPVDYDKYDWTDTCEYVIGGCSSLLIEAILRAKYFNTGQKFKQFPFPRRGIPLSIESHDSEEWSIDAPEFTKWIEEDPYEDLINCLRKIIGGFI